MNDKTHVIIKRQSITSDIKGTVIDIETIGSFDKQYRGDSREYRNQRQVIFGCIGDSQLKIYCANGAHGLQQLQEMTKEILDSLKRPFYAFNCSFESGVWFHQIGIEVDFDGELQGTQHESKKNAVASLRIPNYDDPFHDQGALCMNAWNCGNYEQAIAHNRACLLKERDILIYRGHRIPDILERIP